MTKELTIPKDIKKISVSSDKEMKSAVEMLSRANLHLDEITKEKEKLTKPLNQTLKEIRSRYKPVEEKLESIITAIRTELTRYQTIQINEQKAEEDRISKLVSKGKIDMETAIQKIESAPQPIVAMTTNSGSISFRPVRCFEIQDHKKIPKEYILLNETMVRANTEEIPGIKYWIEQRPINKR